MKNKIQISVIMGVFNPADKNRFFGAIDSIIRQSFQDWELILYDDGSEEPYRRVIAEAANLDTRIRLFGGTHNRGLAYALNECIRHARGTYIARMDDDDISRADRLERQYRYLETHPQYQWTGSNAELIDSQGVWGYQTMPEIPKARDFLLNSPYIHPSVMIRKECLTQHGGYSTSKEILQCEDYELFMRLYGNGCRGYNIQEALLQYWEDFASYRKRTYRRRIREMKLRRKGFQMLGILDRTTVYYVLKPLLVGAVPAPVHHYIRKKTKRKQRKM
ncbi:glycosyltransferase [Bianquea renquensis]|jgi:glycosyltransferase family 2 candidate b-glycosyltransferase|uniref:Glycosyltransferase n=1 Tax=Bianquea renquensis TaxID=2763661 RepID=A0A926DXD8_9FIRM|nr:glycosyltransferase [Bianquea renquensis]MBC8544965.1 glycosyltransferase [Bianquea renquensis]